MALEESEAIGVLRTQSTTPHKYGCLQYIYIYVALAGTCPLFVAGVTVDLIPQKILLAATKVLLLVLQAYAGSSPVTTNDASCFDASWLSINTSPTNFQ